MTTERELIRELRDELLAALEDSCESRFGPKSDLIDKADAYLATPEGDGRCPHIATSREGTSYCRLAESGAKDAARYRSALEQIANQGPNYGPDGTYKTWKHWADIARDALTQPEKSP